MSSTKMDATLHTSNTSATIARLVDEFKIRFGVPPNCILVGNNVPELLKLGRIYNLQVHEVNTLAVDLAVALIHPVTQ